ncbi:MAG: response regulator, partial [bacterium]
MPEDLRAQVLLVDDEPDHADVMAEALRKPGHVCTIATTVAQALDELKHGTFDIIITDLRMPTSAGTAATTPNAQPVANDGANAGLVVLHAARTLQPQAETIMVTAHGDIPTAKKALQGGAYDFIEKPIDLVVFRNLVQRAAETVALRQRNTRLKGDLD